MKREGRQDGLGEPEEDGGGVRLRDEVDVGETGDTVAAAVVDGTAVVDGDGAPVEDCDTVVGGVPVGVGLGDRDGVDDELISEAKLMPV